MHSAEFTKKLLYNNVYRKLYGDIPMDSLSLELLQLELLEDGSAASVSFHFSFNSKSNHVLCNRSMATNLLSLNSTVKHALVESRQ